MTNSFAVEGVGGQFNPDLGGGKDESALVSLSAGSKPFALVAAMPPSYQPHDGEAELRDLLDILRHGA